MATLENNMDHVDCDLELLRELHIAEHLHGEKHAHVKNVLVSLARNRCGSYVSPCSCTTQIPYVAGAECITMRSTAVLCSSAVPLTTEARQTCVVETG